MSSVSVVGGRVLRKPPVCISMCMASVTFLITNLIQIQNHIQQNIYLKMFLWIGIILINEKVLLFIKDKNEYKQWDLGYISI